MTHRDTIRYMDRTTPYQRAINEVSAYIASHINVVIGDPHKHENPEVDCPRCEEVSNEMDKTLSEMSNDEILAEIARLRERRSINRANAISKSRDDKAPRAGGSGRRSRGEPIALSDDIEDLLG